MEIGTKSIVKDKVENIKVELDNATIRHVEKRCFTTQCEPSGTQPLV